MKKDKRRGQILAEVLVAISIAGIVVGGIAIIIGTSLITGRKTKEITIANGLAQEGIEAVKVIGESSWINIYCPPSGSCPGSKEAVDYKVVLSNGTWQLENGQATTTINGLVYTYYLNIENVNRDESGNIVDSGGDEDPSTQKITVFVSWFNSPDFNISEYITRSNVITFSDKDWVSDNIDDGPFTNSIGAYSSTSGDIIIEDKKIKVIP
jgi:type II secretory pathway pseudopilin PulG